jgi:hypothetical protein
MEKRPPIDWEAIERDYAAGMLSVREVAKKFSISHTAIQKRAKEWNWSRDLSKKIKRAVARKLVASSVATLNEKDIVEAEAATVASVQVLHRKDISKSQAIVEKLRAQLDEALENREAIEEAIDKATVGEDGKVKYAKRWSMKKAVSLPTHAGVLRDLAVAQKTLIGLERQAFNMGDDPEPEGSKIVALIANGIPSQVKNG